MKLCGAKTRAGTPCQRPPMPNGRCNLHGGKSLAGVAHPGFKDGRHSRYALQGALAEPYARHLGDLDYVALRDEIALVTAHTEEAALKLDTLRELPAVEFDAKERAERETEIRRARRYLLELIEQRRALARTEALRLKMAHDVLTGEQIRAFAAAVLQAVREESGDLELTSRIQARTLMILQSVGAVK